MYPEDDLLPISALQHLLFCERQCALIHVEQVWIDNRLTVEGSWMHRRAHAYAVETRGDIILSRGLFLRSLRLGITGRADVVEFIRRPDNGRGACLPDHPGCWQPRPVEHKRGRPKVHRADEVQLCAQALCLEEMFQAPVSSGSIFYGTRRRRTEVAFNATLRRLTETAVHRLRGVLGRSRIPRPRLEPKCNSCSLRPACQPGASGQALDYVRRELVGAQTKPNQ